MDKITEVLHTIQFPQLPVLELHHMIFLVSVVTLIVGVQLVRMVVVDRRERKEKARQKVIRRTNAATKRHIAREKRERELEASDVWRANLADSGVWYKETTSELRHDTYVERNHTAARTRRKK